MRFEANLGQAPAPIQFLARGANYELRISPAEAWLTLRHIEASEPDAATLTRHVPYSPVNSATRSLRMQFLGANLQASVHGQHELSGKVNYLIGTDPAQWRTDIPLWAETRIDNLYPGIGMVYYGNQQQLEYDFIVEPGADVSKIAIRFDGVDEMAVDSLGNLVLSLGQDQIRQPCPALYQVVNGTRVALAGGYRRLDERTIGFTVGPHDPGLPLVIDPAVSLAYASYFGGTMADLATAVKVDATGAVYVAGGTLGSIGFSTPPEGFQTNFQGGKFDGAAFVAKFDRTLTNLVFFTYFGGTNDQNAFDLAIDSANNVYVTGYTDSTNFPVFNAAFDHLAGTRSQQTGYYPLDAFVVELDSSGSTLIYSTFLGGKGVDVGDGIAVDAAGSAFVTGYTYSYDFPTVGAFQPHSPISANSNAPSAFLARIAPGGGPGSLLYSSYLGGSISQEAEGVAVDATRTNGLAFITGFTASPNFPIRPSKTNVFLSKFNQSSSEAFVAEFDTSISGSDSLRYSTFLGGPHRSAGFRIALDAYTNIYVTGFTASTNVAGPATDSGLYSGTTSSSPNNDAFLVKFDFTSVPTNPVYSVVFGGKQSDGGWDVALDPSGQIVYVVGATLSTNFPTTNVSGLLQPVMTGGNDAFIAAFSQSNNVPVALYSALLGGSRDDFGYGIAADSEGNAYLVGRTWSPDFPTLNPLQPFLTSASSAFLAKVSQSTNDYFGVTLQTDPPNLSLLVDGMVKSTPDVEFWPPGSIHDLSAPPVSGSVLGQATNIQYAWTAWSDGEPLTHEVLAASSTLLTASFKTNYFLAMFATNTEDGLIAGGAVSPGSGWFDAGSVVSILATPASSTAFTRWVGAGPGSTTTTNNPSNVTMGGPIVETASFSGPLTNVLTVVVHGHGSVSPDYNGDTLHVGHSYSITARPATTNLFSNWTGDLPSTNATLKFQMQEGLVLQANFIPNPFVSSVGSYAGLFAEASLVRFQSSGYFSGTVNANGSFSARIVLAGTGYSFSGYFARDGSFSTTIFRNGRLPLFISLQLDLASGNFLTGQITDGSFLAQLAANRKVFSTSNPPPQAGKKYTVVIAGAPDASTQPGGHGYGTVSVDSSGNVTFSATLGDGTKISQTTFVSKQGQWPLYVPLYGNLGSILGPITFTNDSQADLSGPIFWLKPVNSAKYYPAGLNFPTQLVGSLFAYTNGVPILALTNGVLVLHGGNLDQDLTNLFTFHANNTISGTNHLSLSISSSGLFQGSMVNPETRKTISLSGAVLQKQNLGAGLFKGTNETGSVFLGQ